MNKQAKEVEAFIAMLMGEEDAPRFAEKQKFKVGDIVVYTGEATKGVTRGMMGKIERIYNDNYWPYYVRFDAGGISKETAEGFNDLALEGLSPLSEDEIELAY